MPDKMFCPKCGKPDQEAETFCRQCGTFLPDFSKPQKKRQGPEEHVKVNTVLNAMTIVVSFGLAIALYVVLGFKPETHILIYVTAGLLIAMGGWHVQTLWRSLLLKKHFKKNRRADETTVEELSTTTEKLLDKADFKDAVPNSVTERTTRNLVERERRSS